MAKQDPNANKVGTKETKAKTPKEKPAKEQKPKRVSFLSTDEATPLKNADGKLNALPTTWDFAKHKNFKRGDFANEADFMEWRASRLEVQVQTQLTKVEKLRKQAGEIRQSGDPARRAQMKRLQRLREQQAELEALLLAEGVEIPTT